MARQILDLATANSGTGTTLRAGGDMINDNFAEVYGETTFTVDFVDGIYGNGSALQADLGSWLTSVSGAFTRGGSDHRYINSSGYLVQGTADTVRLTHDPVTLEPLGVLLEPERQNLMLYSDVTSHGTWAFSNPNVTKTANNTNGIEGTTTMTTILETTTVNAIHRMWYYAAGVEYTAGNIYCFSVYLKQIGDRGLQVVPVAAMGLGTTNIDFAAGIATNGWNLEPHKDGIFRLWKTATASANGVASIQFFPTKSGGTIYTGATNSGFGVEKIQLEQVSSLSDKPSSYINNAATTQNTRSADALAFTAPSGDLHLIFGDGTHTNAAPGAGAYSVPTSNATPVMRRITDTLPVGEFSKKVLRGTVPDITDGIEVVSMVVKSGTILLDDDGTDILKADTSTIQLTTGTTTSGTFRGIVIGANAASTSVNGVGFSNSVCIGTDAGKIATTFASSTVINDTAAGAATAISNSEIIGNEAGNRQTSVSQCVFIGNFSGYGFGAGSTASTSTCIGRQAGRGNALLRSVIVGADAGKSVSSGTLTDCVIIGAYAGDNVSGSRTGLILIGASAEAPTGTTDNYLNIGNVIKSDLTGTIVEFPGTGIRIATQATPASASATGTKGDIVHDENYIYICTATNTWKRVAIATW